MLPHGNVIDRDDCYGSVVLIGKGLWVIVDLVKGRKDTTLGTRIWRPQGAVGVRGDLHDQLEKLVN